MHPLSSIATSFALLAAVVSAFPANTGPSSAAKPTDGSSSCQTPAPSSQPEECVPGRVVAPDLIILKDATPTTPVSEPSGNTLSLSLGPQGASQDQIALFRGIPSNAKECSFGWKQREKNTKETFGTDGNALVEYRTVPVEGGPYSFADVTELAKQNDSPSMIDFTSWDQPGFATDEFHVGGKITCAEQIHMHMRVSKVNGETGGVRMQGVSSAPSESELQGVFVQWTC